MNRAILSRATLIFVCIIFLKSAIYGQTIKVTLLGTGCPPPVMNRFGPSILVEAGDQKLIFDTGRGTLLRLTQIKVGPKDISGVFLTHLHSDHLVGFPDLWLTGWVNGRRETPVKVFGPKGTAKMMSHLEQAFEYDIKIRLFDDRAAPEGVVIEAKDISEGVVYEKSGVKVTAFEVDHAPIKPAFGYRIDYAGRSVVLSGDTRYSENLIKFAKGTDLLIHEVVSPESLKRAEYPEERVKGIVAHHTTPEQAGELFSKVKPRLAVYSHIVLPSATEQDLIPPTRKTYAGALHLGEDLMVIEVGEKIEVRRPPATLVKPGN
jgi:ribonuclease Z